MAKTWFITGTSKGFGRVWAEAALARGDQVVATARDTSALHDLVATHGDQILPMRLDIADRAAVFTAVQRGAAHFGGIDVFVNNAGFGSMGTVEEISEAQARQQFETNLFGTLWGLQAVAPIMREQGHGHIIAVSSQLGLVSIPTAALYAASKWALEGLVQGFAAEMAPFGVNVTLIEPAGYKTGFYDPDVLVVAPRMSAYADVHAGLDQPDVHSRVGCAGGNLGRDPGHRRCRAASAADDPGPGAAGVDQGRLRGPVGRVRCLA